MSVHPDLLPAKPMKGYIRDLTITVKVRGSRNMLLSVLENILLQQTRYKQAKAVQNFEVDWK